LTPFSNGRDPAVLKKIITTIVLVTGILFAVLFYRAETTYEDQQVAPAEGITVYYHLIRQSMQA
jgi:hypothetical protein